MFLLAHDLVKLYCKMKYIFYLLLITVAFCSCSTTRSVPEGQYLLDKFKIESSDKDINVADLEDFVRQRPNSDIPLLGKFRLKIYNIGGQDTAKWLTRAFRKIGESPVIYSRRQAGISAAQIEKELSNYGYLNARVDTFLSLRKKKASVIYKIDSGTPYTVRNSENTVSDTTIRRILNRSRRISGIKPGVLFDKAALEEERVNMNNVLRNAGYYSLSKEVLYYKADTTLNSHQVDLYLSLYNNPDSTDYKRYRLRNIIIRSGYDATSNYNARLFQNPDTIFKQGITIIHGRNNFLRSSTLLRNNYLSPGQLYSNMLSTRTYSAFNNVGAVKQTNIEFTPVGTDTVNWLDARITLSPANVHWFQAGVDGTNSAGDIGIAPSVAYRHRNIFNGAEVLGVKLKGAYEFIANENESSVIGENYYEYGVETSLSFPLFLFPWVKRSWREIPSASTQITLGLTNQNRSEYIRQFFNATYTFRWSTQRARLNHSFDFMDVNYVRMPWKSNGFKDYLKNPILNATYQDQLIARTGYAITYTGSQRGVRYPRNTFTIRTSIDLAGWLPHLLQAAGGLTDKVNGQYRVVGIAYAEYMKTTFGFSHTRNFNRQNSFAYNAAIGFANPFGNSQILPYEKRFFSGGANSVRGWSTRRLGPGAYKPDASTSFVNQVGDIKLDLNVEYRNKLSKYVELAGFIDAGNVWTIRQYDGQEGGLLTFSDFYKEIALSYGLGLRFDLNFLLLRLDTGMKAYNPSRSEGDRFVIYRPQIKRDLAWHFAIGYPF